MLMNRPEAVKHSAKNREPNPAPISLSLQPASGRLYKKIKGKRHDFGYASDWQVALDKSLAEKIIFWPVASPPKTWTG